MFFVVHFCLHGGLLHLLPTPGSFARAAHLAPTPDRKTASKFTKNIQTKNFPAALAKLLVIGSQIFVQKTPAETIIHFVHSLFSFL